MPVVTTTIKSCPEDLNQSIFKGGRRDKWLSFSFICLSTSKIQYIQFTTNYLKS